MPERGLTGEAWVTREKTVTIDAIIAEDTATVTKNVPMVCVSGSLNNVSTYMQDHKVPHKKVIGFVHDGSDFVTTYSQY